MFKDEYSVTDIALMTGLSDRTIRTYIKKGLLRGKKRDGIWLFSDEDFGRFINENYVKQSINIKSRALVNDFLINDKKKAASICLVFDYPVEDEEASRIICQKAIEGINTNKITCVEMSYNYDIKNKMARLIIIGPPDKTVELMQKCIL
jgi:hypothetical protein